MLKLTTMISAWLWAGIFSFLYFFFICKKEIKKAELDSVHLCVLFFVFCFAGIPMLIKCIQLFISSLLPGRKEDSFNENVDMLIQIKEKIELIITLLRK